MSYESRLWSVAKGLFPLALPVVVSSFVVFWNLESLGLSHWDEFSYVATAKWFIRAPGGVLTFYEPPGFSFAVAVFFRMFGVKDYVAIAVSGAFAIATVLLMTYVALKLLGFQAALTAPILLVLSPLFLTYSRMALTDMAFTFFFSLAIFSMYRAMRSGRLRDATLAGLALGACTMTKYNGFMPLIVFVCYLLITVKGIKARDRMDNVRGWLRVLLITCVPSLVLAFLYFATLGISAELPTSQVLSLHALRLIAFDAPSVLAKGFARFNVLAVQNHVGQLEFYPLTAVSFYVQVLLFFVSWPILFLAVIGVLRKNLKDGPELFVAVWLLVTIFLIASIPAQYTRAILPALPPLALSASLGVSRLSSFVQSVRLVRVRLPKLKFKVIAPLLLVLVIALSVQGAFQAIAVEHRAYREAGQLLVAWAGQSPVLAETQPVMAFYYPVNFGQMNDTSLARNRYIVIDFIAAEDGYIPAIRQLEQEGRLKLVATVYNDVPPEVYLDSITFQQLRDWNYTDIQIYEVVNGTITQSY